MGIDRKHKLIRRYQVTDAAVHDSQVVEELLSSDNTAKGVWADSAYRSEAIEKKIKKRGLTSRIHRKGYRNRPLQDGEKRAIGVGRGFGHVSSMSSGRNETTWAGRWFAVSGLCERRARIGLKNLAYNMRRLVHLQRPVVVDSR